MIIRTATKSDLPGILDIYNDAILNTTAVYDYEPHTLAMRQAWLSSKRTDGWPVFVAEQDEAIVGFGSLGQFRAWAAYQYTVEHSLYVAVPSQGQGIGKGLLSTLIAASRDMGLHTMLAGIDSDNVVSCGLHERFGFHKVAHLPQVGYKFDRWLDLVFWQLML